MDFGHLERIQGLTRVLNILAGLTDENAADLNKIVPVIEQIKSYLVDLRMLLHRKKESIEIARQLCDKLNYYEDYMNYIEAHIPELTESPNNHGEGNFHDNGVSPQCSKALTNQLDPPMIRPANTAAAAAAPVNQDSISSDEFISPVSVQEFNMIHKYMKGRLTVQGINSFIDIMNSVLKKKYIILRQKASTLKKSEKEMYFTWRDLEKTTGIKQCEYFFTADDLLALEKYKCDKVTYSMIVILRHTKRLKEVRSGSKLLYIVL